MAVIYEHQVDGNQYVFFWSQYSKNQIQLFLNFDFKNLLLNDPLETCTLHISVNNLI